jgi:hypothetical protein
MSEYDDDSYVAQDFHSLIGSAQLSELQEVERKRDLEREAMRQLAEDQKSSAMTLMQIAGMRSQKEVDAVAVEKDAAEAKRIQDAEAKRKEQEHARLVNKFPPPDLKHNS